jgi:hypothetical protein
MQKFSKKEFRLQHINNPRKHAVKTLKTAKETTVIVVVLNSIIELVV